MCDPVSLSIAAVTIGVASTAASTTTSAMQAQAQADMAKRSAEDARRNEQIQQETLRTRALQEADAANLRKQALTDSAREALAVADVSAGEGGVGGNSVRAIARDIERQRLAGINAVERNDDATQEQLALEARGVRARAAREINSLNPGMGPGLAATNSALQGLGNTLMLTSAAQSIET